MIGHIIDNKGVIDVKENPLKIIHIYRYLSWFFTSLCYIIMSSSHIILKLGVVLLLYLSIRIIISAYKAYGTKISVGKTFIFVETLGIILLLIPTGGLNSPFIWYALNPVLLSVCFSFYYFCWFNLFCYLAVSSVISYFYFNPFHISFGLLIINQSQLILAFILITLAFQLLTYMANKLKTQGLELYESNMQLNAANKRSQETIDQIMSLYQTVEAFTFKNENKNTYQTFVDYTARLTKSRLAFFYLKEASNTVRFFLSSNYLNDNLIEEDILKLKSNLQSINTSEKVINISMDYNTFYAVNLKTDTCDYGFIGFRVDCNEVDLIRKEKIYKLEFIANLIIVILERFQLEEVYDRLILSEEQNRIANEMHDNVVQRLFNITCAIHTTIMNWNNITKDELYKKILLIQTFSQDTMKELRLAIYKLSSRKGGNKSFRLDIQGFLNNVSKLNGIVINFNIIGDEESIDIGVKKGFYRIICEATGNAVRHGRCDRIEITISIDKDQISLEIEDNGCGFNIIEQENNVNQGLGLKNMEHIVERLGGEILLKSEEGKGSLIHINIKKLRYVAENCEEIAM